MKTKSMILAAAAMALLLGGCGDKRPAEAPATSAPAPAVAPKTPVAVVPAPAPASTPVPAAAPPVAASAPVVIDESTLGKTVYGNTCSMCHAAGVAGAPKPGDKADWAPRIAQGKEILHKHALEGFTGAKGMMPSRGGNPKLTDQEVKAAVNFMVDKSI